MALNLTGSDGDGGEGLPGSVDLLGRYEINTGEPLPAFDTTPAVAYSAINHPDPERAIFALICDPKLPPRGDKVAEMGAIDNPSLMQPLDWGVVDWPPEGRRCPAIIYQRPGGSRVMPSLRDTITPMPEEDLTRKVILPMVRVLEDIKAAGLVHRAIRPDNLFWDDAEQNRIVLGDGLCTPPGAAQPVAYETIRYGMAMPTGRGPGTDANDVYALGVTILSLLTGQSPCQGMSDDQVIREKLEHGSYVALVGNQRISLTMLEVLRGLFCDDPKDQWGVDDLSYWTSGRRQNPTQATTPRKVPRAFNFAGEDYVTLRELSYGFATNWSQAAEAIRGGSLDSWLRRAIGDEELIDAVNEAVAPMVGVEAGDDYLVSRVCIALDPDAPLRYRDFRATVGGLGTAHCVALMEGGDGAAYARVIREGLIDFWFSRQRVPAESERVHAAEHENFRINLERPGLDLGPERVAYDLNPNMPCLSPIFSDDFVVDANDLPTAYERLAARGGEAIKNLVDTQVAAFISSRYGGQLTTEYRDLVNQADPNVAMIAGIRIVSVMQERLSNRPLPALCALVASLLEPTITRFHSRTIRRRVRESLKRTIKSGRLVSLLGVADNTNEINADTNAFNQAVAVFAQGVAEARRQDYERENRTELSKATGAQVASFVSGLITSIAALLIFVVQIF